MLITMIACQRNQSVCPCKLAWKLQGPSPPKREGEGPGVWRAPKVLRPWVLLLGRRHRIYGGSAPP